MHSDLPDYMIENHLRPTREQQGFIARAINMLGFEPFNKPIHLYTLDELKEIGQMFNKINPQR